MRGRRRCRHRKHTATFASAAAAGGSDDRREDRLAQFSGDEARSIWRVGQANLEWRSEHVDVSGSAPFSNDGSFDIPLNGTADAQAATGTMDGAFFGPHAEQVGGTFAVTPADGSVLIQDAFVGQQKPH